MGQGLSALFTGEDATWQAHFSVTSYAAHGQGPEPVARTSFFSFSPLHGMELRRGFDAASLDMLPNSKVRRAHPRPRPCAANEATAPGWMGRSFGGCLAEALRCPWSPSAEARSNP